MRTVSKFASFSLPLLVAQMTLQLSCQGQPAGSQCSADKACPGGQTCKDFKCFAVCANSDNCNLVTDACVEGLCQAYSHGCISNNDCIDASWYCPQTGFCAKKSTAAIPSITNVSGSGLADTTSSSQPYYLCDRLVVDGENLASATFTLTGPDSSEISVPTAPANGSTNTDTHMELTLPSSLTAGTYVLAAANAAGSCNTSVPVLQGQPGPQGPPAGVGLPAGTVPYGTGSALDASTISFDSTSNFVGVQASSPAAVLDVEGNQAGVRLKVGSVYPYVAKAGANGNDQPRCPCDTTDTAQDCAASFNALSDIGSWCYDWTTASTEIPYNRGAATGAAGLSVSDSGGVAVGTNLSVAGNGSIGGGLTVAGNTTVSGSLSVGASANFTVSNNGAVACSGCVSRADFGPPNMPNNCVWAANGSNSGSATVVCATGYYAISGGCMVGLYGTVTYGGSPYPFPGTAPP